MPLPVAVATAVEIVGAVLAAADAIEKIVGLSSTPPPSEEIRKLDELMGYVLSLRNEMRELGQAILREIDRSRQLIQLFELNRMVSTAETALHSLQTSRLTGSQSLKDAALRDSDIAVTELLNAQAFADRAAAIGPFLFAGNARLQVVAELAPDLLSEPSFQAQIASWVQIVREVANTFEANIRNENATRVYEREEFTGGRRQCDYDEDLKRVVCEMVGQTRHVSIRYFNLSTTVSFHRDTDDDQAALDQARRDVQGVVESGVQSDLEQFGVIRMRRTATVWESTVRFRFIVPWFWRLLNRPLNVSEFQTIRGSSDGRAIDSQRLVQGLLGTEEFRDQIDLSDEPVRRKEKVLNVYTRVAGREATPEQASALGDLLDVLGYDAVAAAISSAASERDRRSEADRRDEVGLLESTSIDRPPTNALDVLRNL